MCRNAVDYSLYLVTDSTHAILGDRDVVDVVEDAVAGGVTIVQYRDKKSDTATLVHTATRIHEITQRHRIPLLINDRVDVALAIGAEGVHLGQDDLDLHTARKALGKDAIIGLTACSVEEACEAAQAGADYLGIGTVFATPTKEDTKSIIGTTGLRRVLTSLATLPSPAADIPKVCIGGINARNLQRVLYKSRPAHDNHATQALNGVAVVSAIMGAEYPKEAASQLRRLISTPPPFVHVFSRQPSPPPDPEVLLPKIGPLWEKLAQAKPLSHNMTNTVVQNFAANVALAIGASPIMSMNPAEAADLATIPTSALVLNMGTLIGDTLSHYKIALSAYNDAGRPTLLDPVGAGATAVRRQAVRELLDAGHFDVIKGNEAEIRTVSAQGAGNHTTSMESKDEIKQHGVDSGSRALDAGSAAQLVKALALRERSVILMTGETDLISDGTRTYTVKHGHEYLGSITGSGCALGTVISSFLAIDGIESQGIRNEPTGDRLLAVLAALLAYELAAEKAAAKAGGPGSFIPAFLDALYAMRQDVSGGKYEVLNPSKVELVRETP
ncbi:MAG: hypothetical protein Q9162_006800 [Coniocarpon cinnabarinum]